MDPVAHRRRRVALPEVHAPCPLGRGDLGLDPPLAGLVDWLHDQVVFQLRLPQPFPVMSPTGPTVAPFSGLVIRTLEVACCANSTPSRIIAAAAAATDVFKTQRRFAPTFLASSVGAGRAAMGAGSDRSLNSGTKLPMGIAITQGSRCPSSA